MNSYFLQFTTRLYFLFLLLGVFTINNNALAAVDVSTCPIVDKRSNGNGQASLAAGDFRPAFAQNNPVAANVVGTSYQYVNQTPSSKTGNWNFYWNSATTITNLPVLTRCWIAKSASDLSILSHCIRPTTSSNFDRKQILCKLCFLCSKHAEHWDCYI
jgi:hypothetical protein